MNDTQIRDDTPLYLCDPEKNVNCGGRHKEWCGTECFLTADEAFAKPGKDGKKMAIFVSDMSEVLPKKGE